MVHDDTMAAAGLLSRADCARLRTERVTFSAIGWFKFRLRAGLIEVCQSCWDLKLCRSGTCSSVVLVLNARWGSFWAEDEDVYFIHFQFSFMQSTLSDARFTITHSLFEADRWCRSWNRERRFSLYQLTFLFEEVGRRLNTVIIKGTQHHRLK